MTKYSLQQLHQSNHNILPPEEARLEEAEEAYLEQFSNDINKLTL